MTNNWQDIQTAPKGKNVLIFYKNNLGMDRIIIAEYIEEYTVEGWYESKGNFNDYSFVAVVEGEPTHWMPLPDVPKI